MLLMFSQNPVILIVILQFACLENLGIAEKDYFFSFNLNYIGKNNGSSILWLIIGGLSPLLFLLVNEAA